MEILKRHTRGQKKVKNSTLKSMLRKSILMAMFPIQAMALGMGDIEINSTLNQPLKAKVNLIELEPGDAQNLIVSLGSNNAFIRAGIDRPFFLTKMRFKVFTNKAGKAFIEITSKRPVVEPFLNFLVQVDWPEGRLFREYTILLDPPIILVDSTPDEAVISEQVAVNNALLSRFGGKNIATDQIQASTKLQSVPAEIVRSEPEPIQQVETNNTKVVSQETTPIANSSEESAVDSEELSEFDLQIEEALAIQQSAIANGFEEQ